MAHDPERTTIEQVEEKAHQLEQALVEVKESVRSKAMLATFGGLGSVATAYFLGRRRRKKDAARIEIHRL